MKRTFLLSILAVIPAALLPLAATSQVAPAAGPGSAERVEPSYKYEVYAGYGYTSLNQVNQSRSGLQGVNVSVTRDFAKYFGVIADGADYKYAIASGNPGKPSVQYLLFGPVLHANLYGNTDGFVRVLLGGAHTGGEGMTPKVSFAGGIGVGLEYKLSRHFGIQASGDDIASSFAEDPNHLGYSTHKQWNGRGTIGVAYKF